MRSNKPRRLVNPISVLQSFDFIREFVKACGKGVGLAPGYAPLQFLHGRVLEEMVL